MNKTLILTILFLATVIVAVATIDTDYKFEKNVYFTNTMKIPYKTSGIMPIDQFCSEKNMSVYYDGTKIGCVDNNENVYTYKILFENNSWIIDNKVYSAN